MGHLGDVVTLENGELGLYTFMNNLFVCSECYEKGKETIYEEDISISDEDFEDEDKWNYVGPDDLPYWDGVLQCDYCSKMFGLVKKKEGGD